MLENFYTGLLSIVSHNMKNDYYIIVSPRISVVVHL